MDEYFNFVYWFYLMPGLFAFCLGYLAIERGKMPTKLLSLNRYNSYLSLIFPSFIPFLNILFVIAFATFNLSKETK